MGIGPWQCARSSVLEAGLQNDRTVRLANYPQQWIQKSRIRPLTLGFEFQKDGDPEQKPPNPRNVLTTATSIIQYDVYLWLSETETSRAPIVRTHPSTGTGNPIRLEALLMKLNHSGLYWNA